MAIVLAYYSLGSFLPCEYYLFESWYMVSNTFSLYDHNTTQHSLWSKVKKTSQTGDGIKSLLSPLLVQIQLRWRMIENCCHLILLDLCDILWVGSLSQVPKGEVSTSQKPAFMTNHHSHWLSHKIGQGLNKQPWHQSSLLYPSRWVTLVQVSLSLQLLTQALNPKAKGKKTNQTRKLMQ